MFSMCSELTPRARIPDTRIPQLMQPWPLYSCRGIMANMVLCVIPGQGNSKILNLVKSGSFDSPIFLYIPNDEKTSTGHLI